MIKKFLENLGEYWRILENLKESWRWEDYLWAFANKGVCKTPLPSDWLSG